MISEDDRIILQNAINILTTWAEEWQMEFNSAKCKVIHFGRRNQQFSYTMGGYAPAGTILEAVVEEKDIRIIISNTLKPSSQCAAAVKKAGQVLGRMARSFTYRDKCTWVNLYKIYVRPHLEYSVQAWSPWTLADIKQLEDVQRRMLGMTSGLRGTTYEEKLSEVNLQSLENRRLRGDMIQTWKILHQHDNIRESSFFTRCNAVSQRQTRLTTSDYNLVMKPVNTEIRRQFFSNRVITPWNTLPENVKSAPTLNSFKNLYDRHIKESTRVN